MDGEVFKRGDCAYVISDKTEDFDDDSDETCAACAKTATPRRTSCWSATGASADGTSGASTHR